MPRGARLRNANDLVQLLLVASWQDPDRRPGLGLGLVLVVKGDKVLHMGSRREGRSKSRSSGVFWIIGGLFELWVNFLIMVKLLNYGLCFELWVTFWIMGEFLDKRWIFKLWVNFWIIVDLFKYGQYFELLVNFWIMCKLLNDMWTLNLWLNFRIMGALLK